MPKKRIKKDRTVNNHELNPYFWLVVLLLVVTTELAVIDLAESWNSGDEVTGAIVQLESSLKDAELLKCVRSQCPAGSTCYKGYCIIEATPKAASKTGITGAVTGVNSLLSKPHLI